MAVQRTPAFPAPRSRLTESDEISLQGMVSGAVNLSVSRSALASDAGVTFELADGVTYTLTNAVSLPAGVILIGPTSGSATLAVTAPATINGGTSSLTIFAGQIYSAIPRASSPSAYIVRGS